MRVRALALLVLLLPAGCGDDDRRRPETSPIVRAMRHGGLTLVLRHARADERIDRQELLRSCDFQRNLTVAGRSQARAIGRAVRALKIPIGAVRASPMCRTRDTAKLAFGRVKIDRDLLSLGVAASERSDRRRVRVLHSQLGRTPTRATNTVLVTHNSNIGAALGLDDVDEGEMLVFGKGTRLLGRIRAEDWKRLVRQSSASQT
jgi:phosphohistidine phosphatase SixA